MTRFATGGNQVLFIENTGVRSPNFSDLPRLVRRLTNWWSGVRGFREPAENLIVLSPLLLPFPYSRLCRWINARLLGRSIANWIGATKRSSPILWTFLPTPLVNEIIDDLEPALVVYYCADDLASSSLGAKGIGESERRLFQRADLVFATSRAIQDRAGEGAKFFPFGVDFSKFERRRIGGGPEPADVADIPRPRIGYVGGLHRWVDFELVRQAALDRPGLHFVFVGPEQTDASALKGLANVHLLGTRPHDALPDYLGSFDAGIIPYRLTEYTKSVYPTKLNEYLAMGLPVVSTALPEVLAYNGDCDGLVTVCAPGATMAASLDAALYDAPDKSAARVAAARRNGWDERVAEMSELMTESLIKNRSRPSADRRVFARLARERGWGTAAAAALLLLMALRWTPLAWLAAEPLRASDTPAPADAVVVLGAGTGEGGRDGRGYEERIAHAIALYDAGLAPRIYLASGEMLAFAEQDLMRSIALAKGVPESAIVLGPRTQGTRSMVAGAVASATRGGWRSVLLVSSPFHMRRAVRVWRRQAPDVRVLATPGARSRFYGPAASPHPPRPRTGPTLSQLGALLKEGCTLVYYLLRGWA